MFAGNGSNFRLGNNDTQEQEIPQQITALSKSALTDSGQEPSRLLTPEMMRQLQGTDVDAATAQRVLDDPSTLALRAQQADAEMERQAGRVGAEAGLKEEMADTEKDEASTITTVMAVAMAGRAIRPTLDVLQKLVKAQREDVVGIIEEEAKQIEILKASLDDEVRKNEHIEQECLEIEDKVNLVLLNAKTVQESLARSYGYQRIELWPAEMNLGFEKRPYERMASIIYEEPQHVAVLLKRADAREVDPLVAVIVQQLYANQYKARDEYYIVQLMLYVLSDELGNLTDPAALLSRVSCATSSNLPLCRNDSSACAGVSLQVRHQDARRVHAARAEHRGAQRPCTFLILAGASSRAPPAHGRRSRRRCRSRSRSCSRASGSTSTSTRGACTLGSCRSCASSLTSS